VLLGLAIFVVQGRRHPESETSVYLPGREPVEPVELAESGADRTNDVSGTTTTGPARDMDADSSGS
jgi:hypothetical protein